eukprot:CAMPEP_0197278312 /NCGR_PEP_ID=MMETSP1432-20130617/18470_1 /TAXON_ID=44447 /ORGANISM="Pseudo-nitzschia delicatissima, Strain UNC1205" /LENGTH=142 /DNA_ID=CAMNT_0042744665 /DNA_START=169 /DNA_END=597 /DNA_ORIENTATION=+
MLFLMAPVAATSYDVSAAFVLLEGVRDFFSDDDLVLDDYPRVKGFVPVQKTPHSFLRNLQENLPCHGDFVSGVNQGIMLVVGRLDEAAVKCISRIVRTDLGLANDYIVGSWTLNKHRRSNSMGRRMPLCNSGRGGGKRFEVA